MLHTHVMDFYVPSAQKGDLRSCKENVRTPFYWVVWSVWVVVYLDDYTPACNVSYAGRHSLAI